MPDPGLVIPVSELLRQVRGALEREFPLMWVAGEISNLTRAASGHVYFSLKDEHGQARCVMFRSRAQGIPWRLENGQQVEVRALPSLYETRGDFQLNVEGIRRAGVGRLFEAFARLKLKLEQEGLFDPARKRLLPRYPRTLGVITSPRAAALQDVIAAVRRRAPHLGIILYPSLVQGDGAGSSVAQAILEAGRRSECDLLLVVRGGGSVEDLWGFNEEIVARALADCPLPTISGVGHESDFTIADFVADHRAATPTAAAELATQVWHEALGRLAHYEDGLRKAMEYRMRSAQQDIDTLALRLLHPAARLQQAGNTLSILAVRLVSSASGALVAHRASLDRINIRLQRRSPRIDPLSGRLRLAEQGLRAALRTRVTRLEHGLRSIQDALAHLDPEATLGRGYAIVRDADQKIIADADKLSPGAGISIRFARGEADARVTDTRIARPALRRN